MKKFQVWLAKFRPGSLSLKLTRQEILLAKVLGALLVVIPVSAGAYFFYQTRQNLLASENREQALQQQFNDVNQKLSDAQTALTALQSVDQYKKNQQLTTEIANLQATFKSAASVYDQLLKLNSDSGKAATFSAQFTQALTYLDQQNYASASAELALLQKNITAENAALLASNTTPPANLPQSNAPPGSGYARQVVNSDAGSFEVDMVAADLGSTKVVVETAGDSTCGDNCPVSDLATYVARAGGYAGINGPYFCPAEYPSCAGKTNSFDTLLMNANKVYFNSDNNVYSTVPAVIFSAGSARFVTQSQQWGRDTGPDSVIASQPMLLFNGDIQFGGSSDPKQGSRGNRSFIGTKGNTVYIGVVHSATVAEVARVLKSLSLDNALNLDSGGSVAFMNGGKYIDGPGRQTPFGIVLVHR